LRRTRRTQLSRADLEALGMLAVWCKLPAYDPARSSFHRWAFYQAFRAMIEACRGEARGAHFESAVRRGAQGCVEQDDRPAERDFHNDTPETDLARLRGRTLRLSVSAWLEVVREANQETAPVERSIAATEAVRVVDEEIARLSEEQRTYVDLRFWDDNEVEEVALRMGISDRTLRRRWAETRELLTARLRARGVFGVPEGFGEAVDARDLAGRPDR
jgi:RNA polymerase sigma factor (sigma-70 family)